MKLSVYSWGLGIYLFNSDDPELEFSGSSRAELGRFRAEPSWGSLIFELNPSWKNIAIFFPHFSPPSLYYQILLVYHDSNQFNDNLLGNKVFLSWIIIWIIQFSCII